MSASASITVTDIDRLLPQTQCGKCGHPGCRPYAEAILEGEAINRCPPGGDATVVQLATLLKRPTLPLEMDAESPKAAVIREEECIGCTKCIKACPVDAILGAAKQMHTVIEAECTGCELCVAPCPVDCIDIIAHPGWQAAHIENDQDLWLARRAEQGRRRFEHRNARLERQRQEKEARRRARMQARREPVEPAAQTGQVASTSTPSTPPPAAGNTRPPAAGNTRARKAALSATIRRLEKRLAAAPDDADTQSALQHARQQMANLQTQSEAIADSTSTADHAPTSSLNSLRIARSAAKQRLALANRQLAHARRQGGPEDIAAAQTLVERAEKTWQDACQALDNAERH
ncbi:RnfABCDGE type electron transport complex subunit B [Kushneria marisflavi]|uniref:Electron transporter RnfB n=1 Tax=Kushneria marisflavi TaxID=157779 RepID=A0A240ULL5_9GAMM|nr:RnfABCDGE type electron transport complex subunit B [Kushneria marisflavi]ART62368.1 electron transporter RnfB [Kushneria marisflavi]RKD87478.1 electron transport complex protein RnfB [Kushneria marisflavi]